jgi:hypothetical protein
MVVMAMTAITPMILQAIIIIVVFRDGDDREDVGADGGNVEKEVVVGGEGVVVVANATATSGLSNRIEKQSNIPNSVSYFTVTVENDPIGKGTVELTDDEN